MVGKGVIVRTLVFPVLFLFMLLNGWAYAQPPPPPEVKITITDGQGDPFDHWIDFDEHIVNTPVISNTVTVTNEGTAQVQMAITNPPDLPFSVVNSVGSECTGLLNSSSSCDIIVEFTPPSYAGDISDALEISFVQNSITNTVSLTARVLTAEDQRPSPPELLSPANGSVVVGNMVDFSWSASTDPEGDPVTYDLFICDNQDFIGCAAPAISNTSSTNGTVDLGAISFAGTAAMMLFAMLFAGGISRRRMTALLLPVVLMATLLLHSCGGGGGGEPPPAPSGTEYFWKVVAADGDGNRTDSETRSFIVR